MPDVFTKQKRSEVMALIRSRGNKDTEIAAMRFFRRNGIAGWRRHRLIKFGVGNAECGVKTTPSSRPSPPMGAKGREGASLASRSSRDNLTVSASRRLRGGKGVRPDFVFPKLRVAVFIDGCFWHGCPLHGTKPANNRAFWRRKLARNRARDRLVDRLLRAQGWRVVRVWEHELTLKRHGKLLKRLMVFVG